MNEGTSVYFGGPDLAKNALRDILLQAIESTPSGGEINWICYYFNETNIIDALIDAAKRDVHVTIILDAHPRIYDVNQHALSKLRLFNLDNITLIEANNTRFWKYLGLNWQPHLHSKFYYFSHPTPHALIGSYNPTASGDEIGHQLTKQIGDHAISHNLLVNISEINTIETLKQFFINIKHSYTRKYARFSSLHNQKFEKGGWKLNFLPTLYSHPADLLIKKCNSDSIIKCAISHLKGPGVLNTFKQAAKNGASIEILLEASKRRVNNKMLSSLKDNNINIYQLKLPEGCLMHNKFITHKSSTKNSVMFGSFNWSTRSRILNYEIIATTSNQNIFNSFENRWKQITSRL